MAVTEALIRELERVALAAAESGAAEHSIDAVTVEHKGDHGDLVTNVDGAAEAAIRSVLADLRPMDWVLGEEGTDETGTSDVRWIIDPLDGTANFVNGYPHRSVSIGAWVEGLPAVGVVINTARGDVFTGSLVSPATCDGRRLKVAAAEPAQAVVATGFSRTAERRAQQGAVLARLLPEVGDIRRSGSPALDLCSVAAGWTHAYYEGPLGWWDYAAGEAIVRAAGGDVATAFDGNHTVIIAGNRNLVAWLHRFLAR